MTSASRCYRTQITTHIMPNIYTRKETAVAIHHAFDASIPPVRPYPGADSVLGYLGPEGFTPHVWEIHEWNAASDNGRLRQCGIWLADFGASPGSQARAAAEMAVSLGWHSHAAPLRFIVIDGETSLNASWIRDFGDSLYMSGGFLALDYRSLDAIQQAPSGLDEWVAKWTPPIPPLTKQQEGFQYTHDIPWDGTKVDLSIFSDLAYDRFGRHERRQVPA